MSKAADPERFRILQEQVNPRSTTGSLVFSDDPDGMVYHFKKTRAVSLVETEARELLRVREHMRPVIGVRAVELREYLEDERMLVTEQVAGGESLFNYLWNGSRRWGRRGAGSLSAQEVGALLGRWLRAYHDSMPTTTGRVQCHLASVAKGALDRLGRLEREACGFLGAEVVRSLRVYLGRMVDGPPDWEPWHVARVHGDFVLNNMLIGRDQDVRILDFADSREGLPLEDVARLWHQLWTMSQTSRCRARLLVPCMDALMDEYGAPPDLASSPLFTHLRCWNAICNLLTIALCMRSWGFLGRRLGRHLATVDQYWLDSIDWAGIAPVAP